MAHDIIILLAAIFSAGGAIFSALAKRSVTAQRRDHENLNPAIQLIIKGLNSLGANTIPPPVPEDVEPEVSKPMRRRDPNRFRIDTPPVGFPIPPKEKP